MKNLFLLTGFTTALGHFLALYLHGLTKSWLISSFNRLMAKILRRCENYARYYLDDIIVFNSSSCEEHLDHIRDVFRRIRDAEVKLNRDKCQIDSTILKFLGQKIGMGRVEPSGLRV